MSGICTDFTFDWTNTVDRDKLLSLDDLDGDLGFERFRCYGCTNLSGIDGSFRNLSSITDFSWAFGDCESLTSIPSGLFDNWSNVTNFSGVFYSAYSITSIPSGLFDDCTAATDFSYIFRYCTGITSIPSGLFDNCTEVTTFYSTFIRTEMSSIPSGLFDYCTKVTNFCGVFYSGSITSIPSGLFDNCTEVTDFSYVFGGCTYITSIPSGLFDNCTKVTDFSYAFINCHGVTTDLPEDLNLYNVDVTTYEGMFKGCYNMTGDGTDFIDNVSGSPTSTDCFYNCTSLDDYNDVPAAWGGGGA